MAAKKKNQAGSSKSTRKTVKKTTAKKKTSPSFASMRKPAKSAKKPAPKKQKTAANAKSAKKAFPKPKTVRKATSTALSPAAKRGKKIVIKTAPPSPETATKAAMRPVASAESKRAHFNKSDLAHFKLDLLAMRDRITGQSGSMRNAALQRTDEVNPEEDGTDAFMRLQTLEQVSSQQQIVTNIDEALRSIEKGSYGVCGICGELISKPRLTVLPFAKNCITCQSDMERQSRPGGRK